MNTTSLTKLHHEMVTLRERAEKAESELAKLRAAPADLLNKLSIVLSGEMIFDPPAHLVDAVPETWNDWDKSIYKKYLCETANSWGRRKIIMQARALLQSIEGYSSQAQNGGCE